MNYRCLGNDSFMFNKRFSHLMIFTCLTNDFHCQQMTFICSTNDFYIQQMTFTLTRNLYIQQFEICVN